MNNLLITAIDKNYYKYLDKIPDNTYIVIHDPTEIRGKKNIILEHIKRFNIITIRETMYKYLLEKHGIKSKFILHPFYEFPRNQISSKTEFVSISRIDFDKNIDILLRVNESISNIDNLQTIGIWGSKNDIYVHHHLTKKLGLDLDKYYKGRFEKTFEDLNSILNNAKFVIDMSSIVNDGSGSQYTFLEAIYCDCVLILNKRWINPLVESMFKDKINCFIVETEDDIIDVLKNAEKIAEIVQSSKEILKQHIQCDWSINNINSIEKI